MRIILIRHGIAEDHGPDGMDFSRRLTNEGVERTREVMESLAKFADRPDVILTSPKVRAAQTADLAGKAFDRKPEVVELLARDLPEQILVMLRKRQEKTVMVVGHEPTLGVLTGLLCVSGKGFLSLQVKKAGCACVEAVIKNGELLSGQLLWLTTPGMVRKK